MQQLDSAGKHVRKRPSENGQPPNAAKLSVSYALLGVTKLRRAYWTNGNCAKNATRTDVSEARARAKPASRRCANTQIDARIFHSGAGHSTCPNGSAHAGRLIMCSRVEFSSPSPRRIEQTSGRILSLNYGTLYPSHVRLQERRQQTPASPRFVGPVIHVPLITRRAQNGESQPEFPATVLQTRDTSLSHTKETDRSAS